MLILKTSRRERDDGNFADNIDNKEIQVLDKEL